MKKDIDLINSIVEDLVSSDRKLSETMLKVKVLALKMHHEKLSSWIKSEIEGYEGKEIPDYRVVGVGVFGNVIQDGFGGFYTKNNMPLPIEFLEDKIKELLNSAPLRHPIAEIEDMALSDTDFEVSIPYVVFGKLSEPLANGWKIDSAWQLITKNKIQGIISKIKSTLLDFLMELSDEIREEEDFNLIEDKPKVDNIYDKTIGQISGKTINISIGNENIQQANVGDHSTSNVASGANIEQTISQETNGEIKEFIGLLKEKLDEIELNDDDKEDIVIETERVENQLGREKPKTNIINNSLRVIESILAGVAANAVTPMLLDTLAVILSKF